MDTQPKNGKNVNILIPKIAILAVFTVIAAFVAIKVFNIFPDKQEPSIAAPQSIEELLENKAGYEKYENQYYTTLDMIFNASDYQWEKMDTSKGLRCENDYDILEIRDDSESMTRLCWHDEQIDGKPVTLDYLKDIYIKQLMELLKIKESDIEVTYANGHINFTYLFDGYYFVTSIVPYYNRNIPAAKIDILHSKT